MKKIGFIFFLLFLAGKLFSQDTLLETTYQKALKLKQQKNCSEAVELFEKISRQNSGYKETGYHLGWCYNELQQYGKALEVFQRKLPLTPSDYLLVYERAFSKKALGNWKEALNDYNQVIEWQPTFAAAHSAIAELYKDQLKDTRTAAGYFLKAATLDTADRKNFYWLGWCYNDLGAFEQAIPYLVRAAESPGFRALAFSETGFSYYSLGNYQLALDFLTKSDNIRPQSELTLYYIGICHVKTGNKPQAVKKYNELVVLGSDFAISLLNEIRNMK